MDSESQSPLLAGGGGRRVSTTAKKIILTSLILTATVCFAFLWAVKPFSVLHSSHEFAPPLKKLKNPVVIMISTDGFAFNYKSNPRYKFQNISKLIEGGTEADKGLISVFPTQTFPNHYSIATGLYPANHGIVNNDFPDPDNVNVDRKSWFSQPSKEPKWWLGEPLWVTVTKATKRNLRAMTYFWPGSEVKKEPWTCPPADCKNFVPAKPVPFEQMVTDVLGYFDSCRGEDNVCDEDIPVLFNVYFNQPDLSGHRFGPDSDQVRESIILVDAAIGTLIGGLIERGVYEEVNIILVSDHGMFSRNDFDKAILIEDILENTEMKKLPQGWLPIDRYLPHLGIQTPKGTSFDLIADVVSQMNRALAKTNEDGSRNVKNGDKLTVYPKEKLPERLHYSSGNAADRIPSIIGLADLGYVVRVNPGARKYMGGTHGYDNKYEEMRGIFIGHGPRFRKGSKVESFKNIQTYNLVTEILGIEGADNQGEMSFKDSVLLPLPPAPAAFV